VEEIEDSSGDEDAPYKLPAGWNEPRAAAPSAANTVGAAERGGLPRPTSVTREPPPPQSASSARLAALLPHFVSLASLERRREPTAVDYRGQFDGSGATHGGGYGGGGGFGGGGFGGGGAAAFAAAFPHDEPPPPPPKATARRAKGGRGKGGAKPRNTWRHRGGQKVYFDETGERERPSHRSAPQIHPYRLATRPTAYGL
jgi:hypothetical protein